MTSETDEQFLDSMEQWVAGSLVFKREHRDRLFALARRGAALQDHGQAAKLSEETTPAGERAMSYIVERLRAWGPMVSSGYACPAAGTVMHEAADRIEQLEAALKPLCCTCDRAASDECSRAEVDCPFWNARAALGEERT